MKNIALIVAIPLAVAFGVLSLEAFGYSLKESRLIEQAIIKNKQDAERQTVRYSLTVTAEQAQQLQTYHEHDALIYSSATAVVYYNDTPKAFDIVYVITIK
jgi:D-serine deaminase-like pyridoxal phosphate-dependent protein